MYFYNRRNKSFHNQLIQVDESSDYITVGIAHAFVGPHDSALFVKNQILIIYYYEETNLQQIHTKHPLLML